MQRKWRGKNNRLNFAVHNGWRGTKENNINRKDYAVASICQAPEERSIIMVRNLFSFGLKPMLVFDGSHLKTAPVAVAVCGLFFKNALNWSSVPPKDEFAVKPPQGQVGNTGWRVQMRALPTSEKPALCQVKATALAPITMRASARSSTA